MGSFTRTFGQSLGNLWAVFAEVLGSFWRSFWSVFAKLLGSLGGTLYHVVDNITVVKMATYKSFIDLIKSLQGQEFRCLSIPIIFRFCHFFIKVPTK